MCERHPRLLFSRSGHQVLNEAPESLVYGLENPRDSVNATSVGCQMAKMGVVCLPFDFFLL